MLGALFQTIVGFVLTAIVGARIAHIWQTRSMRETRFFEASKDMYNQMVAAADSLSSLAGRRLYASQRVCLLSPEAEEFNDAVKKYRDLIIEWNECLLAMELAVRTKFRHASLSEFESLQRDLVIVTSRIDRYISGKETNSRKEVLGSIRLVRSSFFQFSQSMMQEARLLHRQMHFGVVLQYDRNEIKKMSTQNLIKTLLTPRIEGEAVVRSPSDFGLPVSVRDARFGIYE